MVNKFEKLSGRFFYSLFVVNGILLSIAAYIFTIPILALPILFAFLFSILNTVFEGKLQHAIASETRATISSVKSLFSEIGAK